MSKPEFNRPNKNNKNKNKKRPNSNWLFWFFIVATAFIILGQNDPNYRLSQNSEITYSQFYQLIRNNATTPQIAKARLSEGPQRIVKGEFIDGKPYTVNIPIDDEKVLDLLRANVADFKVVPFETFWSNFFFHFMPVLLLIGAIWFLSHRGSQMGNKIWSFGKTQAQMSDKDKNRITFKDAAGVEEAKEELEEVIEFLKDPKKFERLGGKIPKGVLLVGPPGTGKTLLAKAAAGEADVPFFSLSGSDFVEMFVGVGASRVRDLFKQARKASSSSGKGCIIFIDEIDAVGRQRFTGLGGGNDEREQTLNALLVEMDGFNSPSGLIVMAATNRPDTLDPALLRPGRFDRQIVVGLPDIKGREGILKVHSKKIKLGNGVDLSKIAQQTVYFSGADLANVCNEAALLAARQNKDAITQEDLLNAVERVTMGPEKKSNKTSSKEKEMTAYHEAGHALLSLLIDEVDTFTKVSIIPRGMAGGYTLTPPKEDRHYMLSKELEGQMCVLLGGLVAEQIYQNDTSTGVSNDLQKVAQIARSMVCSYGMNDKLGKLAFTKGNQQSFLGRDIFDDKEFSEETSKKIDQEVHELVNKAYNRARKLLTDHGKELELIARRLLEKEVMDIEETRELLNMPEQQDKDNV